MTPMSPVIEGRSGEIVFAKDQPEYNPLPALPVDDGYGTIVTRWRLTWRERLRVLVRGDVYLSVMTLGKALQPVLLEVNPPSEDEP